MSQPIRDSLSARRARINKVRGKGKLQRDVFLSQDARQTLADYLAKEHAEDSSSLEPLFLSALEVASRCQDGRLALRSINNILEQIGRWHDAEITDKAHHISPLRPHDSIPYSPLPAFYALYHLK